MKTIAWLVVVSAVVGWLGLWVYVSMNQHQWMYMTVATVPFAAALLCWAMEVVTDKW